MLIHIPYTVPGTRWIRDKRQNKLGRSIFGTYTNRTEKSIAVFFLPLYNKVANLVDGVDYERRPQASGELGSDALVKEGLHAAVIEHVSPRGQHDVGRGVGGIPVHEHRGQLATNLREKALRGLRGHQHRSRSVVVVEGKKIFIKSHPGITLSTCPHHTNSGCGKGRRILIGPR